MIVTPEEVEELIPIVMNTSTPKSHILSYSAALTRKMLHFSQLTYFSMPSLRPDWKCPSWLRVELGIFSGGLYFEFETHKEIYEYLGQESIDDLKTRENAEAQKENIPISSAPVPKHSSKKFTDKPLNFLQEWIAIRRKGQDFTHTPMGYICQGKALSANNPFFTIAEDTGRDTPEAARPSHEFSDKEVVTEIEIDEDDEDDGVYDGDVLDEEMMDATEDVMEGQE
jgi:hypothetical protein